MHHAFKYLKLLQNHSTFRHVSAAATTLIREISLCKLEHYRYETVFETVFVLWTFPDDGGGCHRNMSECRVIL